MSNEQVLQFVVSKGRLERPQECSDLLYEVMRQCWSWRPIHRPTFWDIVEKLEDHVGENFKVVSFWSISYLYQWFWFKQLFYYIHILTMFVKSIEYIYYLVKMMFSRKEKVSSTFLRLNWNAERKLFKIYQNVSHFPF